MLELNDQELLAEFARTESETAFAAIAARHVDLVYSTALRFTSNPHHAEEITQAVFIILARKIGKLSPRIVLSGWLYQTARLAAANFVKGEIRRQRREQEAYMQSTLSEPETVEWEQLAPLLDEAMGRLGKIDRNAVLLRFFENQTAAEVAATLRLTEAAAHKRANRALEKLRNFFTKRGVTLTATIIAGALSANSVQAAPTGLVATVVTTAAKGAAVTTSITTMVNGIMKIMTWMKIKFAIGIGAAALLVGSTATVALSGNHSSSLPGDMPAVNNLQKVLIATVFLKTPTANVDAVINDFVKPGIAINPNSQIFRDLLKQHPDVDYLGSPSIITDFGRQADASITKPAQIDGTNTDIGIIVNATPMVQSGSKISLKIRSELRELLDGVSPSLRVTRTDDQTQPFKSGKETIVILQKIGKNPNEAAETLLVFVNATIVKQRLQNIIRTPQ